MAMTTRKSFFISAPRAAGKRSVYLRYAGIFGPKGAAKVAHGDRFIAGLTGYLELVHGPHQDILRKGSRTPVPDASDHLPAGAAVRGSGGRDVRRRCGLSDHPRGHRRAAARADLRVRNDFARVEWCEGRLPPGGAGPARDDRPPVEPGRPAKAED